MEKMNLRRAAALVLALALVFTVFPSAAFAAEGGRSGGVVGLDSAAPNPGENPDPSPSTEPTPSIEFSADIVSNHLIVTLGTSRTLVVGTGTASGDDVSLLNMPEGTTYEWQSGDTTKFTVNSNPISGAPTLVPLAVTSAGAVALTVTAYKDGQTIATAQCLVTVMFAAPTSITLSQNTADIDVGKTLNLSASLAPANVCDTSGIIWTLNAAGEDAVAGAEILSPSYLTGPTATYTGMKPGEATVTVMAGDKTAVCLVTVNGLLITRTLVSGSVVDVTETEVRVPLGAELQLEAKAVGNRMTGTSPSWRSSSQGVAFVNGNGKVTTQALGSTQITVTQGNYSATCTVQVVENTASAINTSLTNGQTLKLSSLMNELNTVYRQAMENANVVPSTISYLTNLSVATSQGILYYNYVSPENHGYGVGASEQYYVNPGLGQRAVADLTFVPEPSYTGTAVISYLGYDANRNTFSGTIRVSVTGSTGVAYTTGQEVPVTFRANDFNDVYRKDTGRDISYITFDLPASNQGVLYYNYIGSGQYASLVSSNEKYLRNGSPYLDKITFVPATGFSGAVRIAYHVVDTAGNYKTSYMTITVVGQNQSTAKEINYTAQRGDRVLFLANDFNNACIAALGESLDYLYFTLPSSSEGTLWYNYTSIGSRSVVSASTRYYRTSSTAAVGQVSFVPQATTVGTVSIPYTAYSTGGHRFSGTVTIKYNDIGQGEVSYSGRAGQPIQFNAADFNEVCLASAGDSFHYLRFDSLPADSQGTLYYNYSNYSMGTKVGLTNNFYRISTYPQLNSVTFVPNAAYSGTVSIPFTAYNASNSRIFSGTVNIWVEGIGDAAVRLNAYSGRLLQFSADDFNRACWAITGQNLNYVQFQQLPAANQGWFYYNYNANSTYHGQVSTYSNYYRNNSNQSISNVSYMSPASYTGTLTLTYTGVTVNGTRYNGTLIIQVSTPQARAMSYAGDSLPVYFTANGFYQATAGMLNGGVSYIQFNNLPTESQGALYWGYSSPADRGSRVVVGTRYYYNSYPSMSQLTFVPKAGYTGEVSLSYTAYSGSGEQVPGTVSLAVVSQSSTSRFSDMSVFGWAAAAVDFLNDAGVVYGVGGSSFGPGMTMSRSDYVVMLCRIFGFTSNSTYSFPDVRTDEYYSQALAAAKERGIATADSSGRFRPFEGVTRQDAMVMLKAAMVSAGWNVPNGTYVDLSAYRDSGSIDSYARDAVGAMVQWGVLYGNDLGQLNPKGTLNRAEMVVILHRAITRP